MVSEPKPQLPGIILIITFALLVSCFSWSVPAVASGASLVVITGSASGIDQSTATLNGQITASGSSDITDYGFYYGTDPSCSIKVPVGGSISEGSAYSTQINGLIAGTTYYFMAYAVNSEGSSNGTPVSFATSAAVTAPSVATASASGIDQNIATFNGQITANGGAAISDYGFCWGTDSSCPNRLSVGGSISEGSSFSYSINGLATGTAYYYKAYASNSAGTSYGSPESFTTSTAAAAPTVTSDSATGISTTGGTINGTVTAIGSSAVTQYGFVYGTTSSCTSQAIVGNSISQGNTFSYQLSGLSAGTTYYYKAYAINAAGTFYGSLGSFTTSADAVAPTVTSNSATSISTTYGTINGTVTAIGSSAVTQYGFIYGTTSSCTSQVIIGNSISQGSTFSYQLTGLSAGTTYYYKAYATNAAGTSYGSLGYFTATAATPTVTSDSATSIYSNFGTMNGEITSIGGSAITQYGFYYGTTSSCTSQIIVGYNISQGSYFSYQLTGLSAGTTYYYKPYAINAGGISYGSLTYFTTTGSSSTSIPTVETDDASSVDSDSATLNGYISSVGGYSITQYGFYYGTTSSCASQLIVGYSSYAGDSFTYTLSGLSEDVTYYFKAYATNDAGTSYGEIYSFTTDSGSKPSVATKTPSVSEGHTTLYGYVTSKGGSDIESYGFYYGTSSSPSSRVVVGTDDIDTYDTFSYTLSSLYDGTTYYFKAYATNSDGTSYGSVLSFTAEGAAAVKTTTTTTTQQQTSSIPVCVFTIGSSSYSMNGRSVTSDVAPYIKNNRTYLPLYTAANALGISTSNISWDGASGTVTVVDGSRVVVLAIGSQQIVVNSVPIHLEVAPEISNGRTCLPVGLISQFFGATCTWNPSARTVTVQQSA